MYDSSMKYKWDNQNVMDYAVQEGFDKGVVQGLNLGIEKGIEKGKHAEAINIARELKKEGLDVAFIAKTTKISIEEIEKL